MTLSKEKVKTDQPLVSIFVPYYNDNAFLKDCIDSILEQSYENFELILLNHASTDDSAIIAHSYTDRRIVHIDMAKNLGAGGGMLFREFLNAAKGEYLKPFCADDIMLPECLADLVNYMETNPAKDFVFGDVEYANFQLQSLKTSWFQSRENFDINDIELDILKKFFLGASTLPYIGSLIKRECLDTHDFDIEKTFIMLFDMSLWLDLLSRNKKIGFLSTTVALYRIHEGQVSSTKRQEKINTCSYFESILYHDFFYKIKDINIVKYLCENSYYSSLLTNEDVQFIPFVLAHYYLSSNNVISKISGYIKIHEILSNDESRELLENKFGFGIKEFRDLYTITQKAVLRPKQIGFFMLCFLLLRRIFHIITLRDYKNSLKQRKYTA